METVKKEGKTRILSIDIMRGLTLFLMLFVNDLYEPGVPKWMVHAKATEDIMGLADWVFPGFLFMVGMSIPFAFLARRKKGETNTKIAGHIVIRTLSLLIIGVMMVNVSRLNPELTGMNRNLWAFLAYFCVFLIWNKYPDAGKFKKLFLGLKGLGVVGLIALGLIFKAGTPEAPSGIVTSWWGILGLIGWGYLAAAFTYLWTKGKLWSIVAVWAGFLVLNILAQTQLLSFLDVLKPYLGVLIDGNTPSIVLFGLIVGTILLQHRNDYAKLLKILLPLGVVALSFGFFLRNWFIISKIIGTPTWAMICNGISILVFCLLFYIMDVKGHTKWANVFKPAGQNSLTTYLAPDMVYYTIWGLGLHILIYKQPDNVFLAVGGSLCWAFAMILFAHYLSKIHIRLKL